MKKDLFCLLVDDDRDDHDIFQMSINRIDRSIQVDHAYSAMEALQMLRSYKQRCPDFIFLDLNMHIMTGVECLLELKKVPGICDIPVIIYSTSLNELIKYHTLRMGAYDHIEKPARANDLDSYLKRVFQIDENKPPGEVEHTKGAAD